MNAGAAVVVTALLAAACATAARPAASKATAPAAVRLSDPDPATGARWMRPVLAEKPGPGWFFYFGVDRERGKGAIHAVFEAWSERWLLADRVLLAVDDKRYEIAVPASEWTRGHARTPGGARPVVCVERVDVLLGASNPALVAAVCAARRVEVRVAGKLAEASLDARTPVFLDAVREICKAHEQPSPPATAAPAKTAAGPGGP